MVVVGEYAATAGEAEYFRILRSIYKVPIYYQRFDWQSKQSEAAV